MTRIEKILKVLEEYPRNAGEQIVNILTEDSADSKNLSDEELMFLSFGYRILKEYTNAYKISLMRIKQNNDPYVSLLHSGYLKQFLENQNMNYNNLEEKGGQVFIDYIKMCQTKQINEIESYILTRIGSEAAWYLAIALTYIDLAYIDGWEREDECWYLDYSFVTDRTKLKYAATFILKALETDRKIITHLESSRQYRKYFGSFSYKRLEPLYSVNGYEYLKPEKIFF